MVGVQHVSSSSLLGLPALSPEPPRLAAPRLLEVGSESPVSCSLDGLFPASEARVYLALGAQRLHPDIILEGDALRAAATATASAEQEGATQLACSVTLGRESRETWENVTVYSKRERGRASRAWGWRRRNAKAGQRVRGVFIPEWAGPRRAN